MLEDAVHKKERQKTLDSSAAGNNSKISFSDGETIIILTSQRGFLPCRCWSFRMNQAQFSKYSKYAVYEVQEIKD